MPGTLEAHTVFDENSYICAIWVFDIPGPTGKLCEKYASNVMTTLYKDGERWRMDLRLRTYLDDKAFNSEDHKECRTGLLKHRISESSAFEYVNRGMEAMCRDMRGVDFTVLNIRGGSDRLSEVLAQDHRFHQTKIPKDEIDAYERGEYHAENDVDEVDK